MENTPTNGQQQTASAPTETERRKAELAKIKKKFYPGLRITLLLSLALYLAMLVVGCLAVHKCPVEPNVPLFLIAVGGIGLFSKFLSYVRDRIVPHVNIQYFESSLYSVELVFLILGSYWVFKEYKPSFDPADGSKYCQKTAYMFAFVYVTFIYALLVAIFVGFCAFLVCICFLAKTSDDAQNTRDVEAQNV